MSHAAAPPAAPLIGFGQVRHTRLRPRRHAFAYPTFFLMLPMRSLPGLGSALAVNRRGAISFHDVDHGDGRSAAQGGALAWLDELLRTEGVTEAELTDAKTYLTGALALSLDSSGSIAGLLHSMQIDGLSPDHLTRRAALIAAVTLDDVRKVARHLLRDEESDNHALRDLATGRLRRVPGGTRMSTYCGSAATPASVRTWTPVPARGPRRRPPHARWPAASGRTAMRTPWKSMSVHRRRWCSAPDSRADSTA